MRQPRPIGRTCRTCGADDWKVVKEKYRDCRPCAVAAGERSKRKLVDAIKRRMWAAQGARCACVGCGVADLRLMELAHLNGDGAAHRSGFSKKGMNVAYIRDCEARGDVRLTCRGCNGHVPAFRCPYAGRPHYLVPGLAAGANGAGPEAS